jgi:hypothetical protein
MNKKQQETINATKEIESLENLNKLFVENLELSALATSPIGKLLVTSQKISCLCLGKTVTATHRPVFFEEKIKALEFDFVALWDKEELSILRLYLQTGGIVTIDVDGKNKLCDFNDAYISSQILLLVSGALLRSPVFAPNFG